MDDFPINEKQTRKRATSDYVNLDEDSDGELLDLVDAEAKARE
jgi:hypothetical protein